MTDEELLSIFINKVAIEQKFVDHEVQITTISSGGANYTSKLYILNISGKGRDDLKLFAKVAAMSEKLRGQTPINPFKTEQFVYTELIKTYRELEEKYNIPHEHQFNCPKYYGADITHLREIMVLEDLGSRGFGSANRFKSLEWGYAAAAFTELAKFHALSMVYQQKYPKEYEKTIASFSTGLFHENEGTDILYSSSVKLALETVREENRERLKTWLDGKSVFTYTDMIPGKRRQAIIHLDFRPNNMLHRVREDGTTEIYTVDYQTLQKGCPAIDVLYFIFAATDGEFRPKYYQQLLDHYHSELGAALSRFGLNVKEQYPKEDFEMDIKERLSCGLLISVLFLPILTVAEDDAPKLGDTLDMATMSNVKTGAEYRRRLNEAIDDFISWGVL